jgi:hypothetical protein
MLLLKYQDRAPESRRPIAYLMRLALLLLGDRVSIDSKVTPICTGLEILFRRQRRRILGWG